MSFIIFIVCGLQAPAKPEAPIDIARAKEYFALAQKLWDQDGGKLWGVPLHGPMVFVDPATRSAVGNRADAGGTLKEQNGVFVGTLPRQVGIANYSFRWHGEDWVMLVWPTVTAGTPHSRAVLLMHESWHRIQTKVGLPIVDPKNNHLDTLDGRYWLQLEWRALAAALRGRGADRDRAVRDALLFRAVRREQFADARVIERQLEMLEGMAEYSGVMLAGMTAEQRREYVIDKLANAGANYPTFVRSFAYVSGPAYGLLLEETGADWRKGLTSEIDLGALLQKTLKLDEVEASLAMAQERAKVYDGVALREKEETRRKGIEEKLAGYRKLFVEGPVLTLPMVRTQMQFNPNTLQPLDKLGIVYLGVTINADWGHLKVQESVLVSMGTSTITLVAPKEPQSRPLKGPGWELDLKADWEVVAGPRAGDWKVKKK